MRWGLLFCGKTWTISRGLRIRMKMTSPDRKSRTTTIWNQAQVNRQSRKRIIYRTARTNCAPVSTTSRGKLPSGAASVCRRTSASISEAGRSPVNCDRISRRCHRPLSSNALSKRERRPRHRTFRQITHRIAALSLRLLLPRLETRYPEYCFRAASRSWIFSRTAGGVEARISSASRATWRELSTCRGSGLLLLKGIPSRHGCLECF